MSAFPSAYLQDKILDAIFNNTSFAAGASLYLALFTEDPGADGSGEEVSGGSYARQALSFDTASGGDITTDASVAFSNLPSATITHYGIFDDSTGGNLLVYGELPAPIIANVGDDVSIDAGGIDYSFIGG